MASLFAVPVGQGSDPGGLHIFLGTACASVDTHIANNQADTNPDRHWRTMCCPSWSGRMWPRFWSADEEAIVTKEIPRFFLS
jgi:hypothetical protein